MKTPRFRRAKKSLCGRIICRLLGEERGAVLLEYVLLALLIATAAVAGLMVFNKSIRDKIFAIVKGTTDTTQTEAEQTAEGYKNDAGTTQTLNQGAKDISKKYSDPES